MRRQDDDRGAALVEFAVVAGFLVLLVIGAAEWGLAFKDWLGVASGSRAGARVAAQAGDEADADCFILESTAGAIRQLNGRVTEVAIFRSSSSGNFGPANRYVPDAVFDGDELVTPLVCSDGWREVGVAYGVSASGSDPGTDRDNIGADMDGRDWIGVRVTFEHDWITNFPGFTGSVTWSDDTVMRMEPDPTP